MRRELSDLRSPTTGFPDNALYARAPHTQELHARLRAATSPEALEALALGRLCRTAVEVAGGTGTVAHIVTRLLECAREVVPTAHAQAAPSSPAVPLAGSDPLPGGSIAAAAAAVPDVVVGDDRFELPVGVPPACLMEMTLRNSGCGPCLHAHREEADGGGSHAQTPHGYCEQCGRYRHVSEEAVRPEELEQYCVQCERPCCLECVMTCDVHNHTIIPMSQARDNLTVRLPGHTTHFTLRVSGGHGEIVDGRRALCERTVVVLELILPCDASAPMTLRMGGTTD